VALANARPSKGPAWEEDEEMERGDERGIAKRPDPNELDVPEWRELALAKIEWRELPQRVHERLIEFGGARTGEWSPPPPHHKETQSPHARSPHAQTRHSRAGAMPPPAMAVRIGRYRPCAGKSNIKQASKGQRRTPGVGWDGGLKKVRVNESGGSSGSGERE
jgi:hypothetical protein